MTVSPHGTVRTTNNHALGFHVAAEDRWHHAEQETGVRQVRRNGTTVTETRMRVPGGDVVSTAYAVADHGGVVVIEYFNDSPLPVVIGIDCEDVIAENEAAIGEVRGADLGSGGFTLSLGHHARTRVALAGSAASTPRFGGISEVDSVVRGWTALAARAGRYELPAGMSGTARADAVIAVRCSWMLGDLSDPSDSPVDALIEREAMSRMGVRTDELVDDVAHAVAALRHRHDVNEAVGLRAAERVLHKAGETRAVADVARLLPQHSRRSVEVNSTATAVWHFDERFAQVSGDVVDLFPFGLSADWDYQPLEVFDVPTAPGTSVSFALRWHGNRPAIVWESTGDPATLTASVLDPQWSTRKRSGEHLWSYEAPTASDT